MGYYIRQYATLDGAHTEVWKIEPETAFRVGISDPPVFRAEAGETIWDAFRRMTQWFEPDGQCPFHKARLQPGEFYPRIARPNDQHPHKSPGSNPGARNEANVIAITRGRLIALTRQLDRICQTVQPTEGTFGAFGHDIRNLLILACTEAESHWRGVLVANGVSKDRFNTTDYVALKDAMRLNEYAVDFPNYPWMAPIRPYADWGSTGRPTQELPWYDPYNAVKHNREAEFERATLGHALQPSPPADHDGGAVRPTNGPRPAVGITGVLSLRHSSDLATLDVYIYPYRLATGCVAWNSRAVRV